MQKQFDDWNNLKKHLDGMSADFAIREREIWWASIGVNVGKEQDGKGAQYERLVLVIRPLTFRSCFAVPLTTSPEGAIFAMPLGRIVGKDSYALLSDLRALDTKRFINCIGEIDAMTFSRTRQAVRRLF